MRPETLREKIERIKKQVAVEQEEIKYIDESMAHGSAVAIPWLERDYVRYPLIFVVALGFFYLLLNFRALTKQATNVVSPPPKNEEVVLGGDLPDYETWIGKYYVYVNDRDILAPGEDPDRDGLANKDEYHLETNPLKRDTDMDGRDDGGEILIGLNPLYDGSITSSQQNLIDTKIALETIRSRRDYQNVERVAGSSSGLPVDRFTVDPSKPGQISIPKLNIDAPVIWSKEFSKMEEDLKNGAAHHPATPYPGERGTASIHGHSSGYPWDGDFQTVFTKINFLEPGDEVFVTEYSTKGESRRYRFVVRSKKVYSKTDPEQFADHGGYFLNLSTSWPIGTAKERYVVTTELAGF